MSKFRISEVMDNYINNTLKEEAEKQRQLDAFVRRMTSRSPDVADQYKVAPQPGHGPGTYQPRARATGKDVVSLFIPDSAFKSGDWQDFQRARDKAISWLRSHKYAVEEGQKLCWGPAFELDSSPLSYRDSDGVNWFNCGITEETDFWQARISASY
ncbi:hypothetical protein [Pseudoflavonifractor phocaeensis]|uniref:hypothetical protein n=1 Tax=Pseudoflavonifractor phocaeensis TaxID=1870988 RepID=UPI0019567565|nr:hypothetical protein [Pseudoflavonifractor phocaeensis]MBM6887695.1 hypothetical protein [Pseudoflavonifractor phocaeensis]